MASAKVNASPGHSGGVTPIRHESSNRFPKGRVSGSHFLAVASSESRPAFRTVCEEHVGIYPEQQQLRES